MTMELPHSLPLTHPREAARALAVRGDPRTEPRAVRIGIIVMAVAFLSIFVVLPLVVVFAQAFSRGIGAYIARTTAAGDGARIALGIGVLCLYVLAFNRLLWRRLYNLAAERLRLD